MTEMLFKEWLSKSPEVLFGFRPNVTYVSKPFYQEQPIEIFDVQKMLKAMVDMGHINNREINDTWPTQLSYGYGTGKMTVEASPYGSYKIICRRYMNDAEGQAVPMCRLVIPLINDFNHRGPNDPGEEILAVKLYDKLTAINQEPIPAPNTDWHNQFVKFVYRFQKAVKLKHPEIMNYSGTVKLNDLNYIVVFKLKGFGNGGPSSTKINEFLINLQYLPEKGLLRSWGYDVYSPSISWEYLPAYSEWDELFSPHQPESQIISCLMEIFMTY
jgi:hypothetical protein